MILVLTTQAAFPLWKAMYIFLFLLSPDKYLHSKFKLNCETPPGGFSVSDRQKCLGWGDSLLPGHPARWRHLPVQEQVHTAGETTHGVHSHLGVELCEDRVSGNGSLIVLNYDLHKKVIFLKPGLKPGSTEWFKPGSPYFHIDSDPVNLFICIELFKPGPSYPGITIAIQTRVTLSRYHHSGSNPDHFLESWIRYSGTRILLGIISDYYRTK